MCTYLTIIQGVSFLYRKMWALSHDCGVISCMITHTHTHTRISVCMCVFKREGCQSDGTDSGNQKELQPKASAAG